MSYASETTVSPEKTRMEIERLLFKFGATEFGIFTKMDHGGVAFVMRGIRIAIEIPLPSRDRFATFTGRYGRKKARSPDAIHREYEQAVRSRWRSLCLLIKAKLVGVEEGATTFEVEFMPYMVTASGQTIGRQMLPFIQKAQEGGGPLLLGMDETASEPSTGK